MLRSSPVAVVLVAIGAACVSPEDDATGTLPTSTFRSGPEAVLKVAGDEQTGAAGEPLRRSLVLRVVDGVGNPVPNVRVIWTVQKGGGDVRPDTTTTDPGGEAQTRFVLGPRLGEHSVQATAGTRNSISLTDVFEAEATIWPVTVAEFRFRGPGGSQDATLSPGDTLRWTNADTVAHALRSVRSPSADAEFDTGRLEPGEAHAFAPPERGSWEYVCRLHPDRSPRGTISVQ